MKHLVITVLIILIVPSAIKAQLFVDNALIPKTSTVKRQYFNGSGGRGYWSLDYLDSIGRVIMKESYYKKKLMSRHKIVYDSHNNKLLDIQTYDINNPERIDTNKYLSLIHISEPTRPY